MFSAHELNNIDRRYFNIEKISPGYIILQSKNTFHYWYLKSNSQSVTILHSHFGPCNFHEHGKAPTLHSALSQIQKHDKYQMEHRKNEYHLGYSDEDLDRMNTSQYFFF